MASSLFRPRRLALLRTAGFFLSGGHVNCRMWTIHGQQAQLQTSNFSGTLDLAIPASGLQQVCCSGNALTSAGLLGISLDQCPDDGPEIRDSYSQDNKLVVRYGDVRKTGHHVELQWRCITPREDLWLAGLELIVSFETPLLAKLPEWKTVSQGPRHEIFSLSDDDQQDWKPVGWTSTVAQQSPLPSDGDFRMILCRFPGQDLSYLEMVHSQGPSLTILSAESSSPAETLRWGLRMSGGSLEKGVILRRIVRGIFLRPGQDKVVAKEAYRQFLRLAPALN